MRSKVGIKLRTINWRCCVIAFFQFCEILRGSNPADDSVRLVGKRGLVDNGIENTWLNTMLFTPVLGKNVMDVYILAKEDCMVEFLA